MDTKTFLGFELPENIGYYVFPMHVDFYRRDSEGYYNYIGMIQTPNNKQDLGWWKEKLDKVLKKK